MNPGIFSLLLLLAPCFACGQIFADDFSDGDFTNNPGWMGDTGLFVVNAGTLQLRDPVPPASGTAHLSAFAPTAYGISTTWEFYVRLQFAPSTSNFARFYLASNSSDLKGPLNGYFLRIGGVSGDGDAIELYRQTGTQVQLLLSGTPGAVAAEPAIARVRIQRNESGFWQMAVDYSGAYNFLPQGNSVLDTIHRSGDWMGIYCRYSASRAQSFFWDDIVVAPLLEDTVPPVLLEVQVLDSKRLRAVFSEPLDTANALNPEIYSLLPGIGSPSIVQTENGQGHRILLEWDEDMENFQHYDLLCTQISDRYGNFAADQLVSFIFYDIQEPVPGDIILTEIMADPNPVVSILPDAEYVELFNASNKVIDLRKLYFSTGGQARPIQGGLFMPGSYIIICADALKADFSVFGNTATLQSFPSMGNTSGMIQISDIQNNIIIFVNYHSSWYRDIYRAAGGWSLELVEIDKPFDCPANWRASMDPKGGSPGAVNSVSGILPDRTGPVLVSASVTQPQQISLLFDEELESASQSSGLFSIIEGIPIGAVDLMGDNRRIHLELLEPLIQGNSYRLQISGALKDCLGNFNPESRLVRLGLPEPIEPGDLIINEVLFNPVPGGHDFLELYNISGKVLNIKGMHIWNRQRPGNSFVQVQADWVLFPGDYAVLSQDKSKLIAQYPGSCDSCILEHPLPALDDDSGNVTLMNGTTVLDAFNYSKAQHSVLLKKLDGISLERLDPSKSAEIAANWHSAAEIVGFATPGYRNSQFREIQTANSGALMVLSEILTPDGDGDNDLLSIVFKTDKPGAILTLICYDVSGRPVSVLAQNLLCGQENLLKWDGTDEKGVLVRSGFYLLHASWFFPDGERGRAQKICVLGK